MKWAKILSRIADCIPNCAYFNYFIFICAIDLTFPDNHLICNFFLFCKSLILSKKVDIKSLNEGGCIAFGIRNLAQHLGREIYVVSFVDTVHEVIKHEVKYGS